MAPRRERNDITRRPEIWDVIRRHAARDRWVRLPELYRIVAEHVTLRPSDFGAAAPNSRQIRWQRNVRNVLQHRKTPSKNRPAEILWDAPTQAYLIPRRPETLPPAELAAPEEEYVPEGAPGIEIDPLEEIAAQSLADARKRELRAIVVRRGGSAFRGALLKAYEGRCALTATNGPPALEAAHIVPYRGPQTNHVANGLLLRADIHTLFDLGLIAVNPFTYAMETAKELRGTDYEVLAGRTVRLPVKADAQPSQRSLLYHYHRSRVIA